MASASSSSSSSSSSSPCPICLEPLKDEAYLDRCFHAFCYKCISQWLRFVGNKQPQPIFSISCPLCKTENLSIIHGFSGDSFQRHYINQNHRKRYFSNAHEFRLQIYNSEGENRGNISDVQRYWKRRKYLQKNIWLQDWLRREIQTLMQEENTDIIMYHIQGVIESFMRRKEVVADVILIFGGDFIAGLAYIYIHIYTCIFLLFTHLSSQWNTNFQNLN
ncbi:uncharacterized protein [Typha angustifolia]|uniref:uncharacterized protein isoform X2 n=1 Tax=Typha angustifolia TaxID=59011 RepID=UPI003C2FEE81